MNKITKLLMVAMVTMCFALLAFSVFGLATAPVQAEATSKWNNAGAANFTVNEDGSVSASSQGTNNAFNQSIYTTAGANVDSYNDFAYSINAKFTDNGIDQPVTFNYGILGGAQINLTFYYQGSGEARGWTNAVIGGTNFDSPTLTMTTYNAGEEINKTEATVFTTQGFAFGLSVKNCGLKAIDVAEGHDFVFRVTKTENGVLIRIYYGTKNIDDNTKLFYSIDIENEVAMETGSSFLGFHAFESVFTVTDPVGLVKSNWYDAGRKATVIDNGNNTVTVTTVGVAEYPYDQSIYTTPAVNGITGTDIAFNFNVKLADNNVGDQPVTFNYGIFGGGQINLTFYYQGSGEARGWTNAVIGGTNFIAPEVSMITYKAGVQKYQAGPSADLSFAAMFASIAESGLKTLATEEGHEFTVRATATETGALLRIYYGATCEKTNLFYSLDIECEDAKAVENSFIGFRAYDNVATVSSAKVFIPKEEEGEEENESIWTLINENEDTAVDYSSWDNANLAGSVTIDDKNASTNGFWKPQLIAKFADLYDGEMSAEYDYAVTATVKANGIGNQNTTETQFWFYYYVNSTNYFGSAFQYVAQWYNAFAYGIENNAALEAASVNGKGNTAKGSSVQIEKTALPLAGLLTGTAGRERTFTTVYSVIEGKGVWIRIYLNSGEGFDHTAVTPVFQAMLYTKNTDVWNVVDAYFGFRFFNADVTISNIEVTQVTKSTEGIVSGATVNGDLGAWKENESLPAVYTVNGDAITVDDTKSSPVSYGEPGLTVAFDALAGEKDYKAEKDFVVGFDVVLAEGEREMSLWLDIIDAKNNYIGVGLFHQNISNEYVWTNNAILSNAGNPISGYTYEGYGKTSVEFENKAYTFEGVMAVPSVAGLKDWGDETGHRFYVRYTVMEETVGEGEEQTTSYRLVIRLYYDYGTGVNFYTDDEILKVVIFDYKNADLEDLSFGIRALSTVMTLSNVSFENASVLVEEGKNATEQPTDSNGTDTAAEPGESTDTGCSKKSSCFGVVGGTDVVLLCGILFAFAVFAFDKKKDAVR